MSEPEVPPSCPLGHGPMALRENPSNLAKWCGTWFDCAPGPNQCWSAVLVPSEALLAQERELAAMAAEREGALW